MSNYRFKLEPYKGVRTRHTCPACERPRCFARYIDTEEKIEFPDNVGRCDHEQHCGYHFTPKDYFAEHPLAKEELYSSDSTDYKPTPIILPPSFIEKATMEQTLRGYKQDNLYCFLSEQLGEDEALQLVHRYHVGTSKHWEGATVFWQIDTIGRVRTGKIMLYNPETGKRVKQPFNHITWVECSDRIGNIINHPGIRCTSHNKWNSSFLLVILFESTSLFDMIKYFLKTILSPLDIPSLKILNSLFFFGSKGIVLESCHKKISL